MRRAVASILFLLVVSPVAAQNLITNGTFTRDLSGWEPGPGNWGYHVIAWSSQDANGSGSSGSVSETRIQASTSSFSSALFQGFPVQGGTTYSFDVAVKLLGSAQGLGAGFWVEWFAGNNEIINSGGSYFYPIATASVGTWTRLQALETAPASATRAMVFLAVDNTPNLTALFDDISATAAAIPCTASVPASAPVSTPVTFTGSSGAPSCCVGTDPYYTWTFGDGSSLSGYRDAATVTHTYAAAGTYRWTFKSALRGGNCAKDGVLSITGPACSLVCGNASAPSSATTNSAVTFTAATPSTTCTGTPAYRWDFGDGQIGTGPSVTHAYSQARTYTWSVTTTVGGQSCVKSGTLTVSDTVSDISVSNFAINGGNTFASGVPVACDVTLRAGADGWAGGDLSAIIYFIDVKGVGFDSKFGLGWGDNDMRIRQHVAIDQYVGPLRAGETVTLHGTASVYAADFIDEVAVELFRGDGTLINGLHHMTEPRPITVRFNTVDTTINCVGDIATVVAPGLGTTFVQAMTMSMGYRKVFASAQLADFIAHRAIELNQGSYFSFGVNMAKFVVQQAIIVAQQSVKRVSAAPIIGAAINELSGFWGGAGGCGALLAHEALWQFTKAWTATTNVLAAASSLLDQPHAGNGAAADAMSGTVAAFAFEGRGELVIRDGSGRVTRANNSGTCETGIPDSACASTGDYLLITAPAYYGPFSLQGSAAASGAAVVHAAAPSTNAKAGGFATESFSWGFSSQPGDSYSINAGSGVPQLQVARNGAITLVNPSQEHVDPSDLLSAPETPLCTANATTLCLNSNRFKVRVSWQANGAQGEGQAVPLTSDTGYFWFFNDANVELVLKVLDGGSINKFFWVFYGALSNVQYTITVTDTLTGSVKTYVNPQGQFASVGDTSAFPSSSGSAINAAPPPALAQTPCAVNDTTLCVTQNRFEVTVNWTANGQSGAGHAVRLTSDTGYFWFFNAANVELVIKVLDARQVNARIWVFYGALSNVQYTITVRDTVTGVIKTYTNPQGRFASFGDTSAFLP